MSTKAKAFDVEKALNDLEALVETLEEGKLSLEDALTRYERGVSLARACETALAQAEQKVLALQNPAVDAPLAAFTPADNAAGE